MEITNISNYPVTVKGERIGTGDSLELEIEDVEKYRNDRRFLLEEDDKSEPENLEFDGDDESDDEEISKPKEQNEDKGD